MQRLAYLPGAGVASPPCTRRLACLPARGGDCNQPACQGRRRAAASPPARQGRRQVPACRGDGGGGQIEAYGRYVVIHAQVNKDKRDILYLKYMQKKKTNDGKYTK